MVYPTSFILCQVFCKLVKNSIRIYLGLVYFYMCLTLVAPEVLSSNLSSTVATTTTTSTHTPTPTTVANNTTTKSAKRNDSFTDKNTKFAVEAKPIESFPNPLSPTKDNPRFRGPSDSKPTTAKPSIVYTEEDKKVRKDFGGNCTNYHWVICSNVTWFGNDVFDKVTKKKIASKQRCDDDVDSFPPVCMYNGWTVTRCHLFCMAKQCNRDLKTHYDKYVSKDGFC